MFSSIPVFDSDDTPLFDLDPTARGTHDVRAWPNQTEIESRLESGRLSERELVANPFDPELLEAMLYRNRDGRWCRCSWEHVAGQRLFAGRLVTAAWAAEMLNDPEFRLPPKWKELVASDCVREAEQAAAASVHGERLLLDPLAQTVTLNGTRYTITDPKAFAVYQEICNARSQPITRADIRSKVRGCRARNKVRQLLNTLPAPIRKTVCSGASGYWLHLPPPKKNR